MSYTKVISRLRRLRALCSSTLLTVFALLAVPAEASLLVIGNHSNVTTESGRLDLGCKNTVIAGGLYGAINGARNVAFDPGAAPHGANVSLSGDWLNNGPLRLDVSIDSAYDLVWHFLLAPVSIERHGVTIS